jgi:nucleoid DNA-binding protein
MLRDPKDRPNRVTRDSIIGDLRNVGFSRRQARVLLSVILDVIVTSLTHRNTIELPFGTFRVESRPERREWRFGKVVRRYKGGKQIVFTPKT